MKQSEKSIIVGGIVLLFLAAFFTISIMVQFLNYGVTKEIDKLPSLDGPREPLFPPPPAITRR